MLLGRQDLVEVFLEQISNERVTPRSASIFARRRVEVLHLAKGREVLAHLRRGRILEAANKELSLTVVVDRQHLALDLVLLVKDRGPRFSVGANELHRGRA